MKSLVRDGYITEVETESDGRYPARTLHSISATGEVELLRMLRDALWEVEAFDTRAALALTSFMFFLSREEVVAGLTHRISKIDALVISNRFHIEDTMRSETTPKYVREVFELTSARLRAEQQWAQQLVTRVEGGEYEFAGETRTDGAAGPTAAEGAPTR